MEKVRGRPLPHLRAWRMAQAISQTELMQRTGLARSTIARAELGTESVSFTNIRKLAEALGITVQQLQQEEPPE